MRLTPARIARSLVVGALCVAISACAWIEEPSSHFSDRQDAQEAEMFAKGWLPEWLPPSSKDLREKHSVDTNASILRFEYSVSNDAPPFGDACEPTTKEFVESPRLDAWWWPDAVTIRSIPRLYDCRDDSGYLAIPADGGVAYFWRMSS